MPIYDYECQTCMKPFEVEARMSDPPPGSCPHCQGKSLRRCISRTAFVLKGTGWYTSDYKSSGKAPTPPAAESSADSKSATPATSDKPVASPKTESAASSAEQKPKDTAPKKT